MKPYQLLFYCGALPVFFIFGNCRKQSDTPSTNLCSEKPPLSADFLVEENFENLNTVWPFYTTDTVSVPNLRFAAKDSSATSFEWNIGIGTYHTAALSLQFPPEFLHQHQTVDVTLTVKGQPNTICFPNDDSVKTITQSIYFTDSTLVNGKFHGYTDDNTSNTYTIEIDTRKPCSDIPGGGAAFAANLSISNLVKGCETTVGSCYGGQYKIGYRQLLFTAGTCQSPGGTVKIGPDNNSVTVDYTVYENGYQQPVVHKKFIGTRVP
jgi:hypothetical protein